MKIEKLTDEERERLSYGGYVSVSDACTALRIIVAQAERIASLERQVESWERGHDYAWAEKRRAEEKVAALEARLAQLETQFDSDAAHLRVTLRERNEARASALQAHGLDPAEIEVDAMFCDEAGCACRD